MNSFIYLIHSTSVSYLQPQIYSRQNLFPFSKEKFKLIIYFFNSGVHSSIYFL